MITLTEPTAADCALIPKGGSYPEVGVPLPGQTLFKARYFLDGQKHGVAAWLAPQQVADRSLHSRAKDIANEIGLLVQYVSGLVLDPTGVSLSTREVGLWECAQPTRLGPERRQQLATRAGQT